MVGAPGLRKRPKGLIALAYVPAGRLSDLRDSGRILRRVTIAMNGYGLCRRSTVNAWRSRTALASARRRASEWSRAIKTATTYVTTKQQINAHVSHGIAAIRAVRNAGTTGPPIR
ncbi:hypothetical protein Psi02_49390 [Planotetraspora silvatica]|uniref:Uncharacterized protein n=1 Tax=Planotetraspora silvatica TaxID=234614 RepID=A0A8J3XPT7_9ACTN|nr:hypothetical protein Psi02_49390 [Planotetraspora silvatica]